MPVMDSAAYAQLQRERRDAVQSLRNAAYALEARMATLTGQVLWDGKPVIDDDDGGTAGVREPLRPGPPGFPPAAAAAEMVCSA
jgi:hypothetical protein